MTFLITPLGLNIQKNPNQQISQNNNAIGATAPWMIYTVPAGKKTIINKFSTQSVGFGNGTKLDYLLGITKAREDTVAQLVAQANPLVEGTTLNAGQIIQITSDAPGNNASSTVLLNYTELPA